MKHHVQISVRDLVAYCLRTGDLVIEFTSGIRAVDGIRSHQIVQKSRPEEYKVEMLISHQVETGDFVVDIGGRIDGVYRYPDRAVVDEIKSTTRNLEFLEKEQNPLHWGQVKVYAYFYALRESLETIEAQLTYYHLDTEAMLELRKTFTLGELDVFFRGLLAKYLEWAALLDQWQRTRDESIGVLSFPFGEYRPGQRHMAHEVYRAVQAGEQLIVEAPTGIGKTMAAIFPAVKALGKGLIRKFFYLTAKTTGRAVAQKALEDLREKGLRFKSLTLTAKEKICFKPGSACNGEECEYARGFYDRINDAVKALFREDGLTREKIETSAREFSVCPFEYSLEMALWVEGIICDYNYAFDPRVYLRRFFGEEGEGGNYVFLVDEANNLVDRSREMFSAGLYKKPFLSLRTLIKKDLPEVSKSIGQLNSLLVKYKSECEEAGQPRARETYPQELTFPLRRFLKAAEQWLVRNVPAPFRQELLNLYFEVNWFLKVADIYQTAYTTCYEEVEGDFRVKLFCMDPSEQLTQAYERCGSAIFFSATLSPVGYFRYILGCEASARELKLPSPFPRENFCLVVADGVSALYKNREQTKTAVANLIRVLVGQQAGNYLIFFPSYQYMNLVYREFVVGDPFISCIVQNAGMTEVEREAFLENFAVENRDQGKTLVGFAVMGGVFGEGIDLVGDRLTGAVVVSVGLPGISLERELIKEYFNGVQGMGFEYAYFYPGMNRVCQAAGRVIRTATDRGVVLLIDSRFSTRRYQSLFPAHWKPLRVKNEEHLKEILSRFWDTPGRC